MFGLIGTKKGMMRVFKEDGASIPVTVIEICKSKIVQRKTPEKDGYYGIQVNYGSKKKVSKSLEKKFQEAKAKINRGKVIVWNNKILNPKFVRYGWKDTSTASLFNKEGLPASSFQTE